MKTEKTILVINDDGIHAPGIRALVEIVKNMAKVVVVAPDKPQSGMGHAVTLSQPIRLSKVPLMEGVEAYQCTGTPVDCVKIATDQILKSKPDLCLSGINHGANHSINVIYSGTMSAALEASIENIPSIGFSLNDTQYNANFAPCKPYVQQIVQQIMQGNWDKHLCLNVNIPKVDTIEQIKGMKVCRQAYAKYDERFLNRQDPMGKSYYWLTGEFVAFEADQDTDDWALNHNYISIVPIHFDFTNYKMKEKLEKIF